jgi:hypothetical protein
MLGRLGRFMRSNAIALIALFFALGGVATALPGTDTVDSGDIINGAVKSVDIRNGSITPEKMAPSVRPRWARINTGVTPSIERNRGVVGLTRTDVGEYEVGFSGNILACGWVATLTTNIVGNDPPEGEVSVTRKTANVLVVQVNTSTGAATDLSAGEGFTVAVYC